MKLLKKLVTFLLVLIVSTIGFLAIPAKATVAEPENEPLIKYDFPYIDDAVEMPILGYMGVPGHTIGTVVPSFLTRANVKTYMDAGFNILSGLYERVPLHVPEVRKIIEICEELELTYFVNDTTYFSSFYAPQESVPSKDYFVDLMSDDFYFESPAFGGIAVRDEPNIFCFDQMAKVNEALNEITGKKKIMYTNLYPKAANQYQLGFADTGAACTWEQYDEYVTSFLSKVEPTILAYDCYTLTRAGSVVSDVNGGEGIVGDYIKSLSMYKKYAKQYNIPFWVTVAAHDHIYNSGSIPLKHTQWTVNTSLAYGAKGIQYYTYWNDGAGSPDVSYWADQSSSRAQGMVSINGAPTDNYYRIQKVNNQIKLIDHVLMGAEHVGIMQFGTQHVELMPEDVLYSFGNLYNITGDAFVGCFTHEGNEVYYIVNNSVDSGVKTFKADFIENVNVRLTNLNYVSQTNPNGQIVKSDANSIGFNLAGGEAILLEVLNEKV